jgi:beta-glucosidase
MSPSRGTLSGRLLPVGTALAASVLSSAGLRAQESAPYRDASRPVQERVADLLDRMTLREKFWQLYMSPGSLDDPSHDYSAGAFGLQVSMPPEPPPDSSAGALAAADAARINSIQRHFVEKTRLGIPIIPFDEALHGLVRRGATVFPQAIGLAATWDTALVRRVAGAIADETRSRGVRQVLSPVLNLADDVRWGRTEETYGEDPHLVSEMGRVFVEAFESRGVIATPKHFVANVGAGGRDSWPIHLGRRFLEEVHFPPFRVAVREAGARSVMTAYNSVDGLPATQNPWLLDGVLKGEWGFGGFVISDAAATGGATVLHMTEPSTPVAAKHAWEAGLDVVFQVTYPQHEPYLRAVEDGLVSEAVIDAAVTRVLTAKFELGLFEDPLVDPAGAARTANAPEHRALAREAARASLVLLENRGRGLPLSPAVSSIAVIGVDAIEARQGGYSAVPVAPVTILDGIRERVGPGTDVRFAPGPGRTDERTVTVPGAWLRPGPGADEGPGLAGRYWDNIELSGDPALERTDEAIDFLWTLDSPGPGIPSDSYSARWTGRLRAPPTGVTRLGVAGSDGYRLWLDGDLILDGWRKRSAGTRLAEVDLAPGSEHDLRLEFFESVGNARLKLVWDAGAGGDADERIREAVAAARGADVAIVVAGLEEGEFRDRAFLSLPGRQAELIRAVASTGTPVVVVIVGGSAVTMTDWIDEVDSVLMAWYPGEQGGAAVADVLFGDADPGGRLPITFPLSEGQLPLVYNHRPTGRGDDYADLTGRPAFPFGYGLSYAEFAYSDLAIEPDAVAPDGVIRVRARVRNTGDRAGEEVVQLYVRDLLASVARPVMALKGSRKVRLEPGASTTVEFALPAGSLAMLDADMRWLVEPGSFRVLVGRSSRDIRLHGSVEVVDAGEREGEDPVYVEEKDPLVRKKLEAWQDLKLGLLLHWGPYSQWGIVESWSLCSEDVPWCERSIEDYDEYRRAYEALQTTFDPAGFDPERWARAARDAGMKYVVFTTKHHDGFSMFDTRLTDYRITAPATPFGSDPRADVTREILDAFRAEGFMTGVYFSKPDWHSPDYWWPRFATPDRNPNYEIAKHPERWRRFVEFTHGQIDELMSRYGPVDILWLDGGWVRVMTPEEIREAMGLPDNSQLRIQSQDIDMGRLVASARRRQPGLIVVDRAVDGPWQNYLTPEARVPDEAIPYPWEVPMPMATSWSYVPDDVYKPARELVHMLADVVSKGGNLLLNIGPGPDGRWHEAAYDRLEELGAWLAVNGEAIYGTRAVPPYGEGKLRLTRRADGTVYAIYLAEEGETRLPASVSMSGLRPAAGSTVSLLGSDAELRWKVTDGGFVVEVPEDVRDDPPGDFAWVFRIPAHTPVH